jgi:UDP-N-acetylglucosamine transferase subunit ALG13
VSDARPAIHLAASGGGHVDLLMAVRDTLNGFRRVWLLQPSRRVDALRSEGEEVHVFPDYDRHPVRGNHLANLRFSIGVVRRQRPRLVITSGAGVTVPFTALSWLSGAKVVFIETMARVYDASASGRVLSRMANRTLVQWPDLRDVYPGATLCHPALLGEVRPSRHCAGGGTFVGVGTHNQPFDRLLRLVDEAVGEGLLPAPVIAQSGSSRYVPRHFDARAWLLPHEIDEALRRSEFVVCHAGSGIISSALRHGRRPLVLARAKAHGEHFDDHQSQLVDKLGEYGLIVAVGDRITAGDLAAAAEPLPDDGDWRDGPSLADALSDELAELTGQGSRSRAGVFERAPAATASR